MKIKVFEGLAIFTWLMLVFFWAIYTNIPKGTMEYLLKTLPVILVGIWIIGQFLKKYKQKN